MLPSKKFLSLPVISLKEGQQIGFVCNIVINPETRSVAALIINPRKFFREQRIIPFNRVVSIGEDAITVSTESQVEKAVSLPAILNLIKEKTLVIGTKVLTENGKKLGLVNEFYIDKNDGAIACIDISYGKIDGLFNGKARLNADEFVTLGHDVLVVATDCSERMEIFSKGFNKNFKSLIQSASEKTVSGGEKINIYWKSKQKMKKEKMAEKSFDPSEIEPKEEEII